MHRRIWSSSLKQGNRQRQKQEQQKHQQPCYINVYIQDNNPAGPLLVKCRNDDSVGDLKRLYAIQKGIMSDSIFLCQGSKSLDEDLTLMESGINQGATLELGRESNFHKRNHTIQHHNYG